MNHSHAIYACTMAACLVLSFWMSGMEAGVFSLNRLRIRQRMRGGDPSAKVLMQYLENTEDFFWTILVGNTITNFVAVCLAFAGLQFWLVESPIFAWGLFGLFILGLYLIGDLLPKMIFQTYPNRLCLALARPFWLVHLCLSPMVSLLTWFSNVLQRWFGGHAFTGRLFSSREEMRHIMQESAQAFSSEERSMINRVLDFQNLNVRHITMPLEKVVVVDLNAPMGQVLDLCHERKLTRLLLEEKKEGRRRIVGIVSLRTALYQTSIDRAKPAREYMKPALFLDDNVRLEEALRRMQKSGHRLAIVLDANRLEIGVVSLQDILKAIFGEVSL